jgi:lactate dehydrogenase-like 2-hydroxyacid dehydrogenase
MATPDFRDVDILLLRNLPEPANTDLMSTFTVHDGRNPAKVRSVVEPVRDRIRGIVTGFQGVPTDIMECLPKLEIVTYRNAGVDKIDLGYTRSRGIVVTHTSPALAGDVADLALALMLGVARRLVVVDRYVRGGSWEGGTDRPEVDTVSNKTLGIIGLGNIGQAIARRGAAMDMPVLYTTRRPVTTVPYEHVPSVRDLAARSDFLVVAAPGTPETHHLVDRNVLAALGPNGYVINIGRGSVIDESALVDALREGAIAGAGLDVFEDEPRVAQGLREMDNVILSPHNASQGTQTQAAMGRLALKNLVEHFSGRPVLSPVIPA